MTHSEKRDSAMKNFFKKIWSYMTDPAHEKYFMIGLPCAAVLAAALILTPIFMQRGRAEKVDPDISPEAAEGYEMFEGHYGDKKPGAPEQSAKPGGTAEPEPSKKPETSEKENPNHITRKDSTEKTGDGKTQQTPGTAAKPGAKPSPKPEQKPAAKPSAKPDEKQEYYDSVYEGKYDGGAVKHVEIDNIEDYITVVDDRDLPEYEQSFQGLPEAPAETEAEIITTPEEARGQDVIIVEESPVLDSGGNQTYTYDFNLGPNGRLMLRDGRESDVYPVDEDGDGVYDYGEYFFVPTTPEEGTESGLTADGYYVSESLYNSDNTPVSRYDVTAEPVMDEVSKKVGWQKYDGHMYYYDMDGDMVKGLKKIDGELCYFDQHGVRADRLGMDVSFYNKEINWQAVKAQGIDFAVIRVGGRGWESGLVYNDSMFERNMRGARNAGVDVGVYFYSTAVNELEAVEEASYALQKTEGWSLQLPIYIDMEFSNDRPNGRADKLSPAQRTDIINAFCETVENSGREAGIYSGQNFYRDHIDVPAVNQYSTWLASYTYNNRLPDFRGRYDMWQFTDRGDVNGIDGYVDLNVIF